MRAILYIYSFLLVALLFICTISFSLLDSNSPNVEYIGINITIGLLSLVFFIVYQQNSLLHNCWAKPSNLFIVSYFIVNYQALADYILGYKDISSKTLIFPETFNTCALLATIGIISFVVGYYILPITNHTNSNYKYKKGGSLFYIVLLQFLFLWIWISKANISLLINGAAYATSNLFDDSNYYELLFNIITYVLFIQIALQNRSERFDNISSFIKKIPKVSLLCMLIYSLLKILSGDRGPAIYIFLAFYYTYIIISKKKSSLKYVLVFVFAGAIFVSILGISRSYSAKLDFTKKLSLAVNSYKDHGRFKDKNNSSIFNATEELSRSFMCNQIAVKEIDRGEPFNYGRYQISYVLNTIPFMPSLALKVWGLPNKKISSTRFINRSYLGNNATTSLGTTCLADFYLDLGGIGIIIGMFLIGLFYKKIDSILFLRDATQLNILLATILLVFSSKAIYISRATFLGEFKTFFITILFLYLYNSIKK